MPKSLVTKIIPKLNKELTISLYDQNFHSGLIPELTIMLNKSYAPLAKKGMKYLASHQDPETTEKRLENGNSFLGFIDKKLVATITLVNDSPNTSCEWYRPREHFFFTQFAVNTEFKSQGIGSELMGFVESFAANNGASEIALDTSEHAENLISYYKRRDYRFIQYIDWDVTNYRSVILSKSL